MQDCSPINTPMAIRSIPCSDDNEPVDATEYRGLVGSLQYLTYTRPDITFAVNRVSQHFQAPTKANLKDVKRILRYLKGTLDFGLRFLSQSSLKLYAFLGWISDNKTKYNRILHLSWKQLYLLELQETTHSLSLKYRSRI